MYDSKTRVHRSFTTMISLVLIVVVSVLAGQALCFAEDEVQQDRVKTDVSMPSALQRTAGTAVAQATPAQRYIELYENSQFVGDREVTREQLLDILDRILEDIEDGKIFIESTDAELLRSLVVEQHEQIVQLNMEVDVLEIEMHELNKKTITLTEQNLQIAEKANDAISQLEDFAAELERYVLGQAALNSEVLNTTAKGIGAQISELRDEVESLWAGLQNESTRLETRFENDLRSESQMLSARMSNLRSDIMAEASETLSDLSVRVENLESNTTYQSLEATVRAQQERIGELERQLLVIQSRYEEDLKALSDRVFSLATKLAALEGRAPSGSSAE